jgi:hypothetical protein
MYRLLLTRCITAPEHFRVIRNLSVESSSRVLSGKHECWEIAGIPVKGPADVAVGAGGVVLWQGQFWLQVRPEAWQELKSLLEMVGDRLYDSRGTGRRAETGNRTRRVQALSRLLAPPQVDVEAGAQAGGAAFPGLEEEAKAN